MTEALTPDQRALLEEVGEVQVFRWLFYQENSEAPKPGVHVMGVRDPDGELDWYKITFPRSVLNPMMQDTEMPGNPPLWWRRATALLEEQE